MNKRNVALLGSVVVALVLALTPILGCAAPEPAPPPEVVKPDKVIFIHFGDLSGPYAPITAPLCAGFSDYFGWYNEETGGIDGVPIEQVFRDTGGDLAAGLAAYAAFKDSKPYPIVEFVYQSADTEALHDRFIEDKIVCLSASGSPDSIYPAGYTFGLIPAYTDSMGAFIDWVVEDWAKKTGEEVKLAILTWDAPFGRAIMVDEVYDYAASKGVDIVYEGVYGVRELDVSTQMTAIKAAGANWVYSNTTAHGPKVIAASAAALGMLNYDLYDTTPGMIHRAGGPYETDESVINLAGELAEGSVGPRSFASWAETENEGVAQAIASADKHDRKPHERVGGYIGSWHIAYTVCHVMNKVVEEEGWDNFNGETVRDQFLKLKDFSSMDLSSLTYTADKPEPTTTRIFKVEGGELLPITDWVTCPDLRPAELK